MPDPAPRHADRPGDPKRRAAYHHGNLRSDLIRATRELLLEQGPSEFKLAEACKRAGVSTAAPYRHFADREELLDAVAVNGFEAMEAAMRAVLAGLSPGSHEAISAIGLAYVRFATGEPNLFRLMFSREEGRDVASPAEAVMSPIECAGRAVYEVLLAQMAARRGEATIGEDVTRAAFPLWVFVHGLSGLLIDDALGVNRLPMDIEAVVADATRRLAGEAKT